MEMRTIYIGLMIASLYSLLKMSVELERSVESPQKVNLKRLQKDLVERRLEDPIFQGVFILLMILLHILTGLLSDLQTLRL